MENYRSADREQRIISTLRVKRVAADRAAASGLAGTKVKERREKRRIEHAGSRLERICIRRGLCMCEQRRGTSDSRRRGRRHTTVLPWALDRDVRRRRLARASFVPGPRNTRMPAQRRIETSGSPELRLHTDRQRSWGTRVPG